MSIYSSITGNIVELDDKLEAAKHSTTYQSGSEYDIDFKSGGNGTKNNPYKYCDPGSFASLPNTNISYSTIISLVGVAASAGTITAALIAQAGGAAVITTSIRTQIKRSATSIAGTLIGMSSSYAKKHGVRMYKRNYCTLQHYVDNAWGDDYWFYGDKVRVYRVSLY